MRKDAWRLATPGSPLAAPTLGTSVVAIGWSRDVPRPPGRGARPDRGRRLWRPPLHANYSGRFIAAWAGRATSVAALAIPR